MLIGHGSMKEGVCDCQHETERPEIETLAEKTRFRSSNIWTSIASPKLNGLNGLKLPNILYQTGLWHQLWVIGCVSCATFRV